MSGGSDRRVPWPVCRRFSQRAPGGIDHHSYGRVTFPHCRKTRLYSEDVDTRFLRNVPIIYRTSEHNIRCPFGSFARWCLEVLRKGVWLAPFHGSFNVGFDDV